MNTPQIKEISFNLSLTYPQIYQEAMTSARIEAEQIFKDKDCQLIYMKLLTGRNSLIKLNCKNDYAKQLKNDIEKLCHIK